MGIQAEPHRGGLRMQIFDEDRAIDALATTVDRTELGEALHRLTIELYPICRSITGNGVRETLGILQRLIPMEIREVPTGTPVFDWTVPQEWNIRDAYVKNAAGERIVDFKRSNLHVVNYSIPIRTTLSLEELTPHLHSLPEHPEWIPHKTSYYKKDWGFCLSHNQLSQLEAGQYEVCIDSTLQDGHLTYGEYHLAGELQDEVLISCHVCHPSLCNDNLSGIAVATYLAKLLASQKRRYSYRFLFIPGQIGSITWLALNESQVDRVKHGMVLVGVGDQGHVTYKQSRQGSAEIDRAVGQVLKDSGEPYHIEGFVPYGYDERQYCSQGFDLPVGCFMRTPHGQFPEYHTSADNLDFIRPSALADSLIKCLSIMYILEHNRRYQNLNPKCEPRLGMRGLYRTSGGHPGTKTIGELPVLWVLNWSDGQHSLLDIAEKSGLPFSAIKQAANALKACKLLQERLSV